MSFSIRDFQANQKIGLKISSYYKDFKISVLEMRIRIISKFKLQFSVHTIKTSKFLLYKLQFSLLLSHDKSDFFPFTTLEQNTKVNNDG